MTLFCPRAKSDMTPCVLRDGEVCRTTPSNPLSQGRCVGCDLPIAALNDKERIQMAEATKTWEAKNVQTNER